jgi:aminoglycoside phosphotransferase (APT) family kinase protein
VSAPANDHGTVPGPADAPDDAAALVEVRRRLGDLLGPTAVTTCEQLKGGWYNTAQLLELGDGRRMVLKTAPDAETPALTHEQGLLGTERLFHRLAAAAGLPVPTVRHHEPAGATAPAEWLLLDYLDGTTWEAAQARIGASDRAALRHRLGELAATVAGITGPAFGYPQPVPGLAAPDWPTAFAGMLRAVLADAERFGVALPVPDAVLADLPARFAAELAEVRRPALVHFDAWEGNILLDGEAGEAGDGPVDGAGNAEGAGLRIVGLIDGERAFFGDPLAELVGLDPLGAAEDDADLLAGYRTVDPAFAVDDTARVRLALYRIYLALIMRVEATPRGYDGPHRDWLTAWSGERITAQLRLLDAAVSAPTE